MTRKKLEKWPLNALLLVVCYSMVQTLWAGDPTRPPSVARAAGAEEGAGQPWPRLKGIRHQDQRYTAIFAQGLRHLGDTIAGARLQAMGAGYVVLVRDGERQRLHLGGRFSKKVTQEKGDP